MKPILHILLRVWVQQFYQRNAGFFLFLFVVLFGVVQYPLDYHFKSYGGYCKLLYNIIYSCYYLDIVCG